VLDATDLSPTVGSEVAIDRDALMAGTHADELKELLEHRGVLVFRDIFFDADEQRTFTKTMGQIRQGLYEEDGLLKVIDIKGTFFWHLDGAYGEVPPYATVLVPQVIAPEGGQTEFANTYAAYEDLPSEEQERLLPLRVMHSMKASMDDAHPDSTIEEIAGYLQYRKDQPLVWQHASGRKSLVLGTTASHVIGMHPAESKKLLDDLLAHATQPKNVYRHEWKPGDVVMWDNTGTMHRAIPFDLASGRMLHRFALEGVEPFAAAESVSA
jgi:alpha-ketoglutarate-dependent taurine dioxygenase